MYCKSVLSTPNTHTWFPTHSDREFCHYSEPTMAWVAGFLEAREGEELEAAPPAPGICFVEILLAWKGRSRSRQLVCWATPPRFLASAPQHSLCFSRPRTSHKAWTPPGWGLDPSPGKSPHKNQPGDGTRCFTPEFPFPWHPLTRVIPEGRSQASTAPASSPRLQAKLSSRFAPFSYFN